VNPSRPSSPLLEDAAAAAAVAPPRRGGPTDPSHDEELRRGILHTAVSRPVAAVLMAAFLLLIAAVPIGQAALERARGDQSVLPDLWKQLPDRQSIRQFEEDLDKASYAREAVRPQLQLFLTRFGRFGNVKAVVGQGRDRHAGGGWLFYQPGVAAVGGPGLLDPEVQSIRRKAAVDGGDDPLFPDPRPAILDFARYLAARGIKLVLFPVPDKAGLQPAELHGRSRAAAPGQNPDEPRLAGELRAAGVLVFQALPPGARLDPAAPPRFLRQDTHWTPAWMEEVAATLARFLQTEAGLGAAREPRRFTVAERTVSRVGDIVDMLGLPPGQALFAPQAATIHEVLDEKGAPFEPGAAGADVLLLGDSFCNIFTLEAMGWGQAAGLAPQLARALGRDVDVIARNDAGAHATRQLLRNELAAAAEDRGSKGGAPERDRLSGKKVVIWELASRELAVGNWKPIDWSALPAAPSPAPSPSGEQAP
jgi:hypothetical protein